MVTRQSKDTTVSSIVRELRDWLKEHCEEGDYLNVRKTRDSFMIKVVKDD